MSKFIKRERFEIIIDSCTSGHKVLAGISSLMKQIENGPKRIFGECRVIIPIQIGTEIKMRIFPEFLEAELEQKKHGHLEEFYRAHRGQIRLVETDISLAYKWFYSIQALQELHAHPAYINEVVTHAQDLAERYGIKPAPNRDDFHQALATFCQHVDHSHLVHQRHFDGMRRSLVNHHKSNGERNRHTIETDVRDGEKIQINREATRFFQHIGMTEKLLVQALYSHPQIYRAVSDKPEFRSFRKDKGERAIESFLFSNRSDSNPSYVTLVISNDEPARHKIQQLRSQSMNSIFVIGSYGFACALRKLNLISDLTDIIDERSLERIQEHEDLTHAEAFLGRHVNDDVNRPPVERKWAQRLVDVVRWGDWARGSKPSLSDSLSLR